MRFGHPISETRIDNHRRVLAFAPGSVFGFVRWTSKRRGARSSWWSLSSARWS
jgi:hypothetical protein